MGVISGGGDVEGGDAAREGRGSLEAERRVFVFGFRFLLPCSPSEELIPGSSSSWIPGTLGGLDIRRPGISEFVV